jgi:hypothetical protein
MTVATEEAEQMAEICDQLGGFAQCAAALRSLASERDALRAENEKLRATLNLAVTSHHEAVNTAISLVAERDALRAALRDIARQKKTDELDTEYDVEVADFEGGYDSIIDIARAALGEKE